jgi:hypothetical protein
MPVQKKAETKERYTSWRVPVLRKKRRPLREAAATKTKGEEKERGARCIVPLQEKKAEKKVDA